jgi:hypothetical protein
VKGLPPNFVVTTLIDKAALERFELEPVSCSSCEEKLPATVRCTDCMDYLCSTCHIAHHRLRLTKGHQVGVMLFYFPAASSDGGNCDGGRILKAV